MRTSLVFFARFVLVSSLAFLVWELVSAQYLATLVPAVNGMFSLTGLPVEFALHGSDTVFTYTRFDGSLLRLQALGHESVYLNLIAVLSLFAATPGRDPRWHLSWAAGMALFLWSTHAITFYVAGQIAVWEYANSLGAVERVILASDISLTIPYVRSQMLQQGLELWNVWSRYALGAGAWFLAVATAGPARAVVRRTAPVRRRGAVALAPVRAATQ